MDTHRLLVGNVFRLRLALPQGRGGGAGPWRERALSSATAHAGGHCEERVQDDPASGHLLNCIWGELYTYGLCSHVRDGSSNNTHPVQYACVFSRVSPL